MFPVGNLFRIDRTVLQTFRAIAELKKPTPAKAIRNFVISKLNRNTIFLRSSNSPRWVESRCGERMIPA